MTRSWRDIQLVRDNDGCNRIFPPLSYHRWVFHSFLPFCKWLPVCCVSEDVFKQYRIHSVESGSKKTMNGHTIRNWKVALKFTWIKLGKLQITFPSFSVTTSKLTRESPLPQSAWLLLDRQEGGVAIFWNVRPSVVTGVSEFLDYPQHGDRYLLQNVRNYSLRQYNRSHYYVYSLHQQYF